MCGKVESACESRKEEQRSESFASRWKRVRFAKTVSSWSLSSLSLHPFLCGSQYSLTSALSLAFFISTIDIVWTATTSWFRLEVKWFYMMSRKRCQVEQPPSTHVTYLFTYSLSPPLLLTPLRDLFFSSLVASNIARDDLVMNKYRYYALMLMTQHLLSMANVIRG